MTTNNTNTSKKTILSTIIADGTLIADHPISVMGRQILKSASDGYIYLYNVEAKRAFRYNADGTKATPITLDKFNAQVAAYKARAKAEAEINKRIREKIEKFEAQTKTDHNAILLDAEREGSKFDYRQSDIIFSRNEAESYEETDSLLDEDKKDLRGHHQAMLASWEEVKGKVTTAKDGSQRFSKPYILLTFVVDGETVPSRAYSKQYNSFKIQANQKFHSIFSYTRDSWALDELVGNTFDIWLHWNEMLGHRDEDGHWVPGEWQADFYDEAAYRARKAEQAKVGYVRGSGTNRPAENKATR